MADEVTIRPAQSHADYLACQAVQRAAWGVSEESYVVPIATLVGAQLHGGLVLGAFLDDGAAVGVSFAFLGRIEGRVGLYSQLTGVAPGYQDRGIGGRLKQAQFEFARSQGLAVVAWAFDPFQPGNARFNLEKLGATAGRYVVDMYGPRTDALNVGVPTDRLIAEWEPDPSRSYSIPPPAEAERLPRLVEAASVDPRVLGSGSVLLEIPAALPALRQQDPALAERWRLAVREGFQAAFVAGYRAVGFLRGPQDEAGRCFYLLVPL